MKKLTKALALFATVALIACIAFTNFAYAAAPNNFIDVDASNEYLTEAVNLLTGIGVIKGTSTTTFSPNDLVTREQMAAFVYRFMKKGQSVENGENTSSFTDLEDPTFFFMISWANSQGIIKGTSANTFEPKGEIILQDAYTMIIRALGYEKNEPLAYPFGYINIAESKNVKLNEGLDSDLAYTDSLTRGDVAIILYNAFFAEIGETKVQQIEKLLGAGSANATYVLEEQEYNPTFCEEYFDVTKVEYQCVGTPHGSFAGSIPTEGFDDETLLFKAMEKTDAPNEFYASTNELNLKDSADSYLMGHFDVYLILDKDNDIDEVLFAQPLMKKITTSNIELLSVTSNTKDSYFKDTDVKVLSGAAKVNDETVYFYNAPYSYLTPKYADGEDKYMARNADNVTFVKKVMTKEVDNNEYQYEYVVSASIVPNDTEATIFPDCMETLIFMMPEVYADGYYEATFYDVDNDGRYEYVEYLPYDAAIVDTDDDKTFQDDYNNTNNNTIYTNDSIINIKPSDDDMIIGIFNTDFNTIDVKEVIKPIKSSITKIDTSKNIITLATGANAYVKDAWKFDSNLYDILVANNYDLDKIVKEYKGFENLLSGSAYSLNNINYYVWNNNLVFATNYTNNKQLGDNYLIVTESEKDGWYSSSFNPTASGSETYVYAYINGKTKWIKVVTDTDDTNIYPALNEANKGTYLERIHMYNADNNEIYTLTPAIGANDEDGETLSLNTDFKAIFAEDKDKELNAVATFDKATIQRRTNKRFTLVTNDDSYDLNLTKDSLIILKNITEDGYEFLTYTDSFEATDSIFNNVEIVVSPDIDHNGRANVVVMYAIVEDFEFNYKTSNKNDRIVLGMAPIKNDKTYNYEYTIFNPYTGKKEVVNGSKTASNSFNSILSIGTIAPINTNGDLEDKTNKSSEIVTYWIIDYNKADNELELAPVGKEDESFVVYYDGDSIAAIGSQETKKEDLYTEDVKITNVTDINTKSLLAANDKYYADGKKTPTTVYAKYPEAIVSLVDTKNSDYDKEAEYIVITTYIVPDNEIETICKLK